MLKFLTGFHHQAAQRIMGMKAKRGAGREWEYPSAVWEMESAWLHPIGF